MRELHSVERQFLHAAELSHAGHNRFASFADGFISASARRGQDPW
jgi:hypothetical protein